MAEKSYDEMKKAVMEVVSQQFRPEFINRIDESVVFHALKEDEIRRITTIQLDHLKARLKQQELTLEITDKAMDFLARAGYDPVYGARPLKRVIQMELENPLAEAILTGEFTKKKKMKVSVSDQGIEFGA